VREEVVQTFVIQLLFLGLMQDCLGPAHGMHNVIKPDLLKWGYSSKEGDDIPLWSTKNPFQFEGAVRSTLNEDLARESCEGS